MKNPKHILITGASSGIGTALAQHYATPGVILHLQGRNKERLRHIEQLCQTQGAIVHTQNIDVTDASAMQQWLAQADALSPLDLVIANAGISGGTGIHGETGDQARQIFAVNIDGVVNTIQPIMSIMAARGQGQVALMSSLAGMRGLPSCPAYSASKAWVRIYGEGLRGWLSLRGVSVCVICPGYIETPMTKANNFPMPFIMSPQKAARRIAAGLAKNKGRIAFPLRIYIPLWLLSCLSPALTDPFFSRLPAKPSI